MKALIILTTKWKKKKKKVESKLSMFIQNKIKSTVGYTFGKKKKRLLVTYQRSCILQVSKRE